MKSGKTKLMLNLFDKETSSKVILIHPSTLQKRGFLCRESRVVIGEDFIVTDTVDTWVLQKYQHVFIPDLHLFKGDCEELTAFHLQGHPVTVDLLNGFWDGTISKWYQLLPFSVVTFMNTKTLCKICGKEPAYLHLKTR